MGLRQSDETDDFVIDEELDGAFDLTNFKELVFSNPIPIALILCGLIFAVFGALIYKNTYLANSDSLEVLSAESRDESGTHSTVIVEVVGEVNNPGVYEIEEGSRVENVMKIAGGVTDSADISWMNKFLNRAAIVADGQKIYIPSIEENSQSAVLSATDAGGDQTVSSSNATGLQEKININTSTIEALDALWGIGRITAQNIIDQRPYSKVEELKEKKILKSNVFERNKDILSVY